MLIYVFMAGYMQQIARRRDIIKYVINQNGIELTKEKRKCEM